ncbi:MAG: D-glycero-alpha-D-manno-heptose-1,7-bisphosphate 7-phosphatase [Bacteroidota bacterium]
MKNAFMPDLSWSLFLDRDGVLNERLLDDYIKTPEEFIWKNGVLDSLKYFSQIFGIIVVVTNQQGIGKGIMEESVLLKIHKKMLIDAEKSGGRIDKVYFAPQLAEENSRFRKPNIGMGINAKKDFPQINFKKSVMVGDTFNDMLFGKRLGMKTILISNQRNKMQDEVELVDLCFPALKDFADYLKSK